MNEEEQAIKELLNMSPEELAKVEHTKVKLQCCAEGCTRYTRIKDYGIAPWYVLGKKQWSDMNDTIWFCTTHWKVRRRVERKEGPGADHILTN